MEISNAIALVNPRPDSHYRLRKCKCGHDQPVYIQGKDHRWRVKCLECGMETLEFRAQHEAQVSWNHGVAM